MAAPDAIAADKLVDLLGTAWCPNFLDNCRASVGGKDVRLFPGGRAGVDRC